MHFFFSRQKSLLLAQQLPEKRNIELKSRHQRVLVDVEPGVVVGSRNVAADAHVGCLSAMGLDSGHQVGGVLGAGEASAGNVAGDLRDPGSPGFYEGLQGVVAVGAGGAAHDLCIHRASEHFSRAL